MLKLESKLNEAVDMLVPESRTVWPDASVGCGAATGSKPNDVFVGDTPHLDLVRTAAVLFPTPIIAKRILASKPHFIDLLVGIRLRNNTFNLVLKEDLP